MHFFSPSLPPPHSTMHSDDDNKQFGDPFFSTDGKWEMRFLVVAFSEWPFPPISGFVYT